MRTLYAVCTLIVWALFPRLTRPRGNEGHAEALDDLRRRRLSAQAGKRMIAAGRIEPVRRKPNVLVVEGESEAEIAERLLSLTQ